MKKMHTLGATKEKVSICIRDDKFIFQKLSQDVCDTMAFHANEEQFELFYMKDK